MDQGRVFAFLADKLKRGQRCVLVTVLVVEGSSMRNPGTHMGVCEDGSFAGSLSGGCIENAVVAEAKAALEEGASRIVRFGAGSPYLDIKLPCGGGLDIHFQPLGDAKLVEQCQAAIAARRPFSILVSAEGSVYGEGYRVPQFDPQTGEGAFGHWPQARLLIVGHGASVEALAGLARTLDCEVEVLTSDDRVLENLRAREIGSVKLERTSDTHLLTSDRWTAIVFLFHDHDWEVELMRAALGLPHFYLGAMGGRTAHAARCEALARAGVSDQVIASIHAPIGLFHSSRDPDTLALSALAQIVRVYEATDFEAALG